MDWDSLAGLIPSRVRGDVGIPPCSQVTELPSDEGWSLTVAQPGVHWRVTEPPGGDYRINLTIEKLRWQDHAFTHEDLFHDVFSKAQEDETYAKQVLAPSLVEVCAEGRDPFQVFEFVHNAELPGIPAEALLGTSQALALCEHRRYKRNEPLGGRCLPTRFVLGIIFQGWVPVVAASVAMRRDGRGGGKGLTELRDQLGDEPSFGEVMKRNVPGPCLEPRRR